MVRLLTQHVKPEWIDYNGHMNVAWYTLAFDIVMDDLLTDHMGMSREFIDKHKMGPFALQSNYCYMAELREGEAFYGTARILDFDKSKIHLFVTLNKSSDDVLSATWEGLSLNVDHTTRKSTPYPPEILEKIASLYDTDKHSPVPEQVGRDLGIRRKGIEIQA